MVASLVGFAGVACAALFMLSASPAPVMAEDAAAPGIGASTAVSRTITLKNLRVGLDKLKSYRTRWTWSFDGKLASGKPYTASYIFSESVIPADKLFARVMTISQTPRSAESPSSLMVEAYDIAGTFYVSSSLNTSQASRCTPAPMPAGFFEGMDLTGGREMRGVRLVKEGDRVNGILADQYALDATAIFTRGVKSASGNIWIARDGSYVVKFTLQVTGDTSLLGQEVTDGQSDQLAEGKLTAEYVVLDTNKVKAIELPATCQSAESVADDIPLPKGATGTFTREGMTMFQSEDKPEALVEFFKKEMPAKGWKAGKVQIISSMTQLEFTKGSRAVRIVIMPNPTGKGTMVAINEEG